MTVPGVAEGCIGRPRRRCNLRKIEKAQDIVFEVETLEATLPRFNPVVRLLEPGGREIATDVYTAQQQRPLHDENDTAENHLEYRRTGRVYGADSRYPRAS